MAHQPLPISCTIQVRLENAFESQMLQQAISSQAHGCSQPNQEPATITFEITPPSPLQLKFDALVMCNFTPRKPGTLPVSRWVSCANTATRAARGLRPPTPLQIH